MTRTKSRSVAKRLKPVTPAAKASAALPVKPEPTEKQKEAIAESARRLLNRVEPVELQLETSADGTRRSEGRHSHHDGFVAQLLDTLGTTSSAFASAEVGALEWMTRGRPAKQGDDVTPVNAALALVTAIRPENELEAALATQMAGTHALTCELLARSKTTDRTDHIQLYGNLAIKLARTFTAQIEALGKMRRGGEQIVRHIHVDNRGGRAIIGETVNTGVGANERNGEQSDGPDVAAALSPALLGQDPHGFGVPIPGGVG